MAGKLLDILEEPARRLLIPRPHPAWLGPMLATLTKRRFSDPHWAYERKYDGVRCIAYRHGKEVRLFSRNHKPLNLAYPELVEALSRQKASDFVVDGEIVAFKGRATSFEHLQGRLGLHDPVRAAATGIAVQYYLFDVMHAEGHDVRGLPLRDRKALLERLLAFKDPLRYSEHRVGDGEAYAAHACRQGWEGLIAKRLDSTYQSRRSHDWLKMKCLNRQEFVVVGYTDPQRSRVGLGALLLAYNEGGELRYAGKVGTGFDDATLASIRQRLEKMERPDPPVAAPVPKVKNTHWVKPALVGEVAFSEWTRDGRLRHPTFMGFRADKRPAEVTRERAVG